MKFGYSLLLVAGLFISGCGENENECKFGVLNSLDKGEYAKVLKTLETEDKQCGFSDDEKNMNIAAAYLGKAGFTTIEIINSMLESESADGDDGFGSFVKSSRSANPSESIISFNRANDSYNSVTKGECKDLSNSSSIVKDSCFYTGLMQVSQTANSIDLIFGGSDEVDKWQDSSLLTPQDDKNKNNQADSVDAATDAIDYALGKEPEVKGLSDGYITRDTTIGDKTFTKDGNDFTFELIKITVGSEEMGDNVYYKLITNDQTPNSPVVTEGVCKLDFTYYEADDTTIGVNYFPCPIIDGNQTMNVNDQLVYAVNNGLENIINVAKSDKDDVSKSTREYKDDLDADKDGEITLEEISEYLKK